MGQTLCLLLVSGWAASAADIEAPVIQAVIPAPGGTVSSLTNITVRFSEPVVGVTPGSLLIDESPALSVAGGGSNYVFTFSQPPPGPVQVVWDGDHAITDQAGNPFADGAPASWSYVVADGVAPVVRRRVPEAGAVIRTLARIEILFSEPVVGVDAEDLTINGAPADALTGSGAGPYVFAFDPPESGGVDLAWVQAHGITDAAPAPNGFAGEPWDYELDPAFSPQVVLSEILAENLTGLVDEDGQKEDWIELHNRGAGPVNLAGWSLSDDPANPDLWVLPARVLNPGQFLVVFASAKGRRPAGAGTNHTNFRLNVNGGYLGLFRPEYPRQVADEYAPEYPALRGDVSFGRKADGALTWYGTATPGLPNADATALAGIVAPPHSSVDSGFFTHAVSVHLSCETPGATIYYTLDGQVPTPQSLEYFGPMNVAGTPAKGVVLLRAAAFLPGSLPSLVTTRTYVFPEHVLTQPASPAGFPALWDSPGTIPSINASDTAADYEMDPQVVTNGVHNYAALARQGLTDIPSISIVTDVALLFGTNQGVYVRREPFNQQPVNAELLLPDGSAGFNVPAGLEIVGGTSPNDQGSDWKSKKLSMRLIFKGEFGQTKLNYAVFPDSPVDQFDTLILDAGLNYVWSYNGTSSPDDQRLRAQYVRDQFMSDLQNATGGLAPHGRLVHVYLNGLYWGLHDLHERPDHSFTAEYFGGDKSEYDVIKHRVSTVVNGSASTYTTLFAIASSGLTNNSVYENLQLLLDLPWFIDYMIVNLWAGNTDWAHQNWYASHKQGPEGRWRYHSWDAEHVMKDVNEDVTGKNDANGPTQLLSLCANNVEFRLRFADHVHRHFFNGGVFYVDPANRVWNPSFPERNRPATLWMKRIRELDPGPIVAESARWGDVGVNGTSRVNNPLTRNVEFLDELDALMGVRNAAGHASSFNYFPQRSSIVLGQFRARGLYPNVEAPAFSQHGGRVPAGFALGITAPAGTIYYTTNGVDPRVYGSGAVSPDALAYTPGMPVLVGGSMQVKARVLSGNTWSALNQAAFMVEDLTLPLRITEIMYRPPGGAAHEFIELRNVGTAPISLAGYTFSGITYAFAVGAQIGAGATLVLANDADPASFARKYPGVSVYGYFDGNLDNGGERLTLKDPAGRNILTVDYDDEGGWPWEADGQGASLELIDALGDPSDPANWRASTSPDGTPGLGPAPAAVGPVVLHEVQPHSITGAQPEEAFPAWVELHNQGGVSLDLTGWSLTTDLAGALPFVFPPETSLAAGGFLVVWCDGATGGAPGLHAGFTVSERGGGLFLYDSSSNRVDALSFGLVPPDSAIGRVGGVWTLTMPTPEAANLAALLGEASNLGLNEWMANPLPGGDDWLELYNRSGALAVPLSGLYFGTSNQLFRFRALSFLAPGGFLQLFAEERSGPDELDLRLPGEGGVLVLYDAAGLELERVTYGPQASGVSAGRLPDGDVAGVTTFPGSASPGASNYRLNFTGPVLAEMLARNRAASMDPWGGFADFVELWNTNAAAFELSGMRLGTRPDGEGAFSFPAGTTLAGGGRLVVWCDGARPGSSAGGEPLNSGFGLPGQGGGLYLWSPNGQVAQGIEFGFQVEDQPIGPAGGVWGLLTAPTPGAANAPLATLGNPMALRINEWMADPAVGEDWFELYNPELLPVALEGLRLTDDPSLAGSSRHVVGALSFIGAERWVRWHADQALDEGPDHVGFSLDGAGEGLFVYGSNLTLIDGVSFGSQIAGASQGRLQDGQERVVAFTLTPTPEAGNFLPVPGVVIHEALSHSDPPLEDAIELRNLSGTGIPVAGWYLSDRPENLRKYRIAEGTVLPADGFLVFYEYQFNGGPGSLEPFTLDSVHGDELWLSQADGQDRLTGYRVRARLGAAANGISFGRHVTSVGEDFVAERARTFGQDEPLTLDEFRAGAGAPNAGPMVGPVVINELMYHPPVPGGSEELDEYVELYNITGDPVALHDPVHHTNTWRLAGGISLSFPGEVVLPAHGYALIVSFDPVADATSLAYFRGRYGVPLSVLIVGPYTGQLDNRGERLELFRPDAPQGAGPDAGYVPQLLVDAVEFGDRHPWPAEPAGTGASLQRRRGSDYGNDPVHWKGQPPSPGRANVPGSTFSDVDQDGLPDGFEAAHGLSASDPADATVDGDGDGRSAYEEFFDGTDLQDPASVLVGPAIVSPPADQTTVPGALLSLSVTATGSSPLRYQWYRDGLPLAGAIQSQWVVPRVAVSDNGRYHVVVWNDRGYVVSRSAQVQVNIPPRITQQPQSQTVSNGANVTLSVSVVGTGQVRYQWQWNGADVANATGPTLDLNHVQLEQAGTYTVVVTDDLASVVSQGAILKVLLAPQVFYQPQNLTVVEGSDATFYIMARGTLPLSYRWRRGTVTLKRETTNAFFSSVTLTNVQLSNSGARVTCVLTNEVHVSPGILSSNAFLTVLADADKDGMDNVFEDFYGLSSADGSDGELDLDGDGQSNRQEYDAGTNPADASSYLRVDIRNAPLLNPLQVVLRFRAAAGKSYSLLYRESAEAGLWHKLGDILPRTNAWEVEWWDAGRGVVAERFYRLVTPLSAAP